MTKPLDIKKIEIFEEWIKYGLLNWDGIIDDVSALCAEVRRLRDEVIHERLIRQDEGLSLSRENTTITARNERLVEAVEMARTRLNDFADKANAGSVHHDGREWKRKIWASFADFDDARSALEDNK